MKRKAADVKIVKDGRKFRVFMRWPGMRRYDLYASTYTLDHALTYVSQQGREWGAKVRRSRAARRAGGRRRDSKGRFV